MQRWYRRLKTTGLVNGEPVTEPLLGVGKRAVTTPFKVGLKGTVQKDPNETAEKVCRWLPLQVKRKKRGEELSGLSIHKGSWLTWRWPQVCHPALRSVSQPPSLHCP